MQRVSVTVSLNGTTLQFEEAAFARLDTYLGDARRTLADNPDRDEILADLEQAVADQCQRRMRAEQSVVTLAELNPALEEIGAVQSPDVGTATDLPPRRHTRPLEQVSEGALISGVCLGLSRYMQVDVTLLRVIAVLLLLFTGGGMLLIYLVLMLLLPYAPAERGAARIRRIPAKTREFVEFVRSKFSAVTN